MVERKTLSPFGKKLLRDLASHWTQVIAIIAVVALGIIMFAGPLLAQKDLRDSISDIYRRTNYEDFSVSAEPTPRESVLDIEGLENVEAVSGRLYDDVVGRVGDSQLTVRVISVPESGRPPVNDVIVESGDYIRGPGECLAEHHFTTEYGLEPGDEITLVNGGRSLPLRVTGSVVSPEFIRLVRSQAEYVTNPEQFAVVFCAYGDAEYLLDSEGLVNNFAVRVQDLNMLEESMAEVETVLESSFDVAVTGLTPAADEPGTAALDFEIDTIGKLALFFAILLLFVASLALYITMTQIVFSQQREIGVMRAVGYDSRSITFHYLGYGLVLGTTGGILGVVCGYYLSRLFINIYSGIFDLPLIKTVFDPPIVVSGLAVALVFSVAGALIPARHAVRMKPAEAMRTDAGIALGPPKRPRRPGLAERLALPIWLRVAFRNLFRNRRRTILTCLGVIATICLMITASGGKDSLDYAVDKYLNGVLRWDVAAVFSETVGPDLLDSLDGVDGVRNAESMILAPARLELIGEPRSAADIGGFVNLQVMAFARDSELHGEYPTRGSESNPGPGEVVLNRSITRKLPVRIGSEVSLTTDIGPSLPFEVSGFVSEPFGGVCYLNLEYLQELIAVATGEEGRFNAVAIEAAPGSEEDVVSALEGYPGVRQVETKESVLKVFEELIGAIKTLFLIFYVMAFSMGFAVLFSMITVNIFERRREIATIRTLGAGRWRIFSFLTVETLAVVLVAMVPGVLLGRLLEWFVIEKLVSSERLAPDVVISGTTVAVILIAAILVMVLSELPSIRRLWRLDLAKVTKERVD